MRRIAMTFAVAALLALPATALAQDEFSTELSHEVEVPEPTVPNDYSGTGTATFTISDDDSEISYQVDYENLTGPLQASHIHHGAAGTAGGIILPLDIGADAGASGSYSGTLSEADFTPLDGGPQTFAEALAAMRAGDTYVNLHTQANGAGELRGQLPAIDDEPLPPTSTIEPGSSTNPPLMLLIAALALAVLAVAIRPFLGRVSA